MTDISPFSYIVAALLMLGVFLYRELLESQYKKRDEKINEILKLIESRSINTEWYKLMRPYYNHTSDEVMAKAITKGILPCVNHFNKMFRGRKHEAARNYVQMSTCPLLFIDSYLEIVYGKDSCEYGTSLAEFDKMLLTGVREMDRAALSVIEKVCVGMKDDKSPLEERLFDHTKKRVLHINTQTWLSTKRH